ncbi:cytochrome c [Cohaesibacter sp. CAU 1516]|nr:cytochrome c [Cohaesibacter sp. CAU 1516]
MTVPKLSVIGAEGRDLFNVNCSACHGEDGKGSEAGPPLIHDIYNPGHHADVAFYLAVANGVRQHHWPYGSMPPLPDVPKGQVKKIVKYVRETQQANGINFKKHSM